jgi:diacylglycerol kinase family enzyme
MLVRYLRRQRAARAERRAPYVRLQAKVQTPALIINQRSGDGKADRFGLLQAAQAKGVRCITLEEGDDIAQLARQAIADGADAIGAAGGDGSLAQVASVAAAHDVPFFCIPLGTRNHFALDLGLDRNDPLSSLTAFDAGEELLIDLGFAGTRPFVNNVSFGIYGAAVQREEYRDQKERTLMRVAEEVNSHTQPDSGVRFSTPEGEEVVSTAMTLVSNNVYVFAGPPDFGRRRRLDAGVLGIASTASTKSEDAARPELHPVRRWESNRLVVESSSPIEAGLDGEAVVFGERVELRVEPRALRVLVPAGVSPGYQTITEAVAEAVVDSMAGLANRARDSHTSGSG